MFLKNHILFIFDEQVEKSEFALDEAFRFLSLNQSLLSIVAIIPQFPKNMAIQQQKYEQGLADKIQGLLSQLSEKYNYDLSPPCPITFISEKQIAISIIQYSLKNACELIIKAATEYAMNKKGYGSLDMTLMRKCPTPVWIVKDNSQNHNIAVAIEAQPDTEEGAELSEKLIKIAQSISQHYDTDFKIISCWNYDLEDSLRNNPWIKMEEEEIQNTKELVRQEDWNALLKLTEDCAIPPSNIIHINGSPKDKIPEFTTQNDIDLLIMGSVGRTGIQGFFMGNTAETIIDNLNCSVLTTKPNGFISPVKAFK